jgi:hypothetical protein
MYLSAPAIEGALRSIAAPKASGGDFRLHLPDLDIK